MRKWILLLSVFLMVTALTSNALAAWTEETVDGVFITQDFEQFRKLAEEVIAEQYPFDSRLYACTMRYAGAQSVLEYRLQNSDMAIFFVEADLQNFTPGHIVYNDTYTLEHYVEHLEARLGGIFRNWSIEDKFWFVERLPALIELDNFRSTSVHPEWQLPKHEFAKSILDLKHSLPDETAISEETARQIALDWMRQNTDMNPDTMENLIVSPYYIISDFFAGRSEVSCWYFRIFDRSMEVGVVYIDAHTGEVLVAGDARGGNG